MRHGKLEEVGVCALKTLPFGQLLRHCANKRNVEGSYRYLVSQVIYGQPFGDKIRYFEVECGGWGRGIGSQCWCTFKDAGYTTHFLLILCVHSSIGVVSLLLLYIFSRYLC